MQIPVKPKYIQLLVVFVLVGRAARDLDHGVHFVRRAIANRK
jgi:hypothetical protein